MNRQIVRESPATRASGARQQGDKYADRLVKLLPAEVVATYLVLDGILRTLEVSVAVWVITGVMLILTPVYLRRVMHVTAVDQLILSACSFAVWALAVGGALQHSLGTSYKPAYGSLGMVVFTFIAPLVCGRPLPDKKKRVRGAQPV